VAVRQLRWLLSYPKARRRIKGAADHCGPNVSNDKAFDPPAAGRELVMSKS